MCDPTQEGTFSSGPVNPPHPSSPPARIPVPVPTRAQPHCCRERTRMATVCVRMRRLIRPSRCCLEGRFVLFCGWVLYSDLHCIAFLGSFSFWTACQNGSLLWECMGSVLHKTLDTQDAGRKVYLDGNSSWCTDTLTLGSCRECRSIPSPL